MTTSHTLAIDEQFTIDREPKAIADQLWMVLRKLLVAAPTLPGGEDASRYYRGAYERASASAPVTTLRRFI